MLLCPCSDYVVECGCGQSRSVCLVARGKYPASSTMSTFSSKSSGGVATDEGYLRYVYVCMYGCWEEGAFLCKHWLHNI